MGVLWQMDEAPQGDLRDVSEVQARLRAVALIVGELLDASWAIGPVPAPVATG